jgi:nucleotide-binding universal stress UspA family protein
VTLLIAVADPRADAELLGSARNFAAAAHWRVTGVHAHGPGEPELPSADLEGLEVAEVEGDPLAELAAFVDKVDAEALALGLRTRAGPGIGRVAETLIARHGIPLFLVRPGMRPLTGLRRLVVPLEGSPSASAAMKHADDALCARGREIVMLHVVTGAVPGEQGSFPAPRIVDQEHYEWSAWQEEFTMRFSQCPEGGRHRVSVRVGDPAKLIVKESVSLQAELIVLSWRGSFAGGRGAVVKELLATAPCPLFIVPAG